MWSHERHSKILAELEIHGKVQTAGLADLLKVSRETVRRDLLNLEATGCLERVHGGAIPVSMRFVPEPAFADRIVAHTEHAEAIGRMAVTLIEPGSTVFVNAGSTTLAFAHELVRTRADLRVITNSIGIAQITGPCEHLETLLLGGTPHAEVPATFGELTLSEIERFLADYAVISPVGFSALRGATDYALHEAEVARKMIRSAHTCMILCCAEKLETESRVNICRPEEIDILITDGRAGPGLTIPRGKVFHAGASAAASGTARSGGGTGAPKRQPA